MFGSEFGCKYTKNPPYHCDIEETFGNYYDFYTERKISLSRKFDPHVFLSLYSTRRKFDLFTFFHASSKLLMKRITGANLRWLKIESQRRKIYSG